MMNKIPEQGLIGGMMALKREGYAFIQNRCKKLNSEIFRMKLFGQNVVCISGQDAAKLFYNEEKLKRGGAIPKRVQKTLFGQRAIQTLDDAMHKQRKELFMSMMTT